MKRYAIPVDAARVLIRADPPTPLEVVPAGAPGEVHVFVAQAASLPVLDRAETRPFRAYFRWDETESFWRRTLYPALFRTERVDADVEVGYLVEAGETVALAGEPGRRPSAGSEAVFGTYREPPSPTVVREPWGPELLRDREGKPRQAYRTPVLRVYLARFPGFSAETVWLKLLRGTAVRPPHEEAFRRETKLFATLAESRPGSAAVVLHHGALGLESYNGLYAALRPPVGVDLATLPRGRGRLWSTDPDTLLAQIAEDLLRTLAVAHQAPEPWCMGAVSVASLRFRPKRTDQGQRMQAVLVSASAAGRPGTQVPASVLNLFSDGSCEYLRSQWDQPYVCSAAKDLQSLGFALEEMASSLRASAINTHALIDKLKGGAFQSAEGVLQSVV